MTTKLLFNGQVLVKPGGASKINATAFVSAALGGLGVVGLVGESTAGAPNTLCVFTRPELAQAYFRSGNLADSVALAFAPSKDILIAGGAASVVCVKVNATTQSTLTASGVPGSGYGISTASNVGPYDLEPAQTLLVKVNGAGATTVTFNAAAATKAGAGATYSSPDTKTLLISVNGGAAQTFTGSAGCTAAAATAALINAQISGIRAVVNGTEVDLISDKRGYGATIEVTGGTGVAAFGQAAVLARGTGTAVGASYLLDIDAVTAAEACTILQAALAGTTVSGDPVAIRSNLVTTGAIEVTGGTARTTFGFDTNSHTGTAATSMMVFTSKEYGLHTANIGVQITNSAPGNTIAITSIDGVVARTETSPSLGADAEFSITYSGNATTHSIAVSSTAITVTLVGDQTDGSATLSIPFATYPTLQSIINFVGTKTGYSAAAVNPTMNPYAFTSSNLDTITTAGTGIVTHSLYAILFRVLEWTNANSALVTAAFYAASSKAPLATMAQTQLADGATGVGTNFLWQSAFNLLGTVIANEVVACASAQTDLTGSATIATVLAMTDAHATYYSSGVGKKERQAYIGFDGTKAAVLAKSRALSSFDSCLVSQYPTIFDVTGTLKQVGAWGFAVICAGLRAGAPLALPITYKYFNVQALTQDVSWSPENDYEAMIVGGVLIAEQIPNKGYRIIKGVTTYTQTDNDAYKEESIVIGWKNISYELRTHIESLFTGGYMSINNLLSLKGEVVAKLSLLRNSTAIVDSILADGTRLNAWRNLTVTGTVDTVTTSVTVSPVAGINFTLNNITIVPAQINL